MSSISVDRVFASEPLVAACEAPRGGKRLAHLSLDESVKHADG